MVKITTGRFLKDDGAGWVEIPDEVARFKVSHCFRDQKRYKQPKPKQMER
jgi:hypothetical protein